VLVSTRTSMRISIDMRVSGVYNNHYDEHDDTEKLAVHVRLC
jgi:hypothetical protein